MSTTITSFSLGSRENNANDVMDTLIIRYKNGSFLEGYANDFTSAVPFFRLYGKDDKTKNEATKIYFDDIQLILFTRSIGQEPARKPKLEITFKDGEVLRGTITKSRPNGLGFFLSTEQNNIPVRVFVVDSAIKKIQYLQ